jgi:hypothetical protein
MHAKLLTEGVSSSTTLALCACVTPGRVAEIDIAPANSRPTIRICMVEAAATGGRSLTPLCQIRCYSPRQNFDELEWIEWEFGDIDAWLPCGNRLRACVLDSGQWEGTRLPGVWVFRHPELVTSLHNVEHPLGRKHWKHFAACFTRICEEIVEGSTRQAGMFTNPYTLVSTLHCRSQDAARVNEYIITSTERVALQE